MAETAKILCPEKTVLIPDLDAGCTLADDCPPEEFADFRQKHSDHFVVSYINCSAAVKAQSDLICTSSNAVDLIKKLPENLPIIFAPDKNLGRWVEKQSGRRLTLWPGRCMVHETFSEEALLKLILKYPKAEVIAHPECQSNLLDMAQYIGSTSKLLKRAKESVSDQFIILTEPGIIHQMKQQILDKQFIEVPGIDGCSCNECPYMRLNTLEKISSALKTMNPTINIESSIREKAIIPILKMLEMSK